MLACPGGETTENQSSLGGSMRILALETTELIGSVALADAENLVLETHLPDNMRSAQSLAPTIQQTLGQVGWTPKDVQLVAVTVGPGSFTGLRIGVVTAKAFAYAVGAELIGVDTHETLALACPDEVSDLATVIDAQRGQVMARTFQRNGSGELIGRSDSELLDLDQWLASLAPGTRVTGPILRRIADRLPPGREPLAPELWRPTAGRVALLAHRQYTAGRRDDLWQLAPVYSRLSAAEEKRRAK
jgi:tRNA threonylcarbamoyladenosine biosynthesis protein TsaB